MESDIVHVIFTFTIPKEKWLAKLSIEMQFLSFYMLSIQPINESEGMCLLQVSTSSISDILSNLSKHYNIMSDTILHQSSSLLILNVLMENPKFINNIIKTGINLQYPLLINNGTIRVEILTQRSKIDQLFSIFEEDNIEFSLKQIGKYKSSSILSAKQNEVLEIALKQGYFDIPRKISLTNLAKLLHIAPASLSENFRRIYKNLGRYYFDYI